MMEHIRPTKWKLWRSDYTVNTLDFVNSMHSEPALEISLRLAFVTEMSPGMQ